MQNSAASEISKVPIASMVRFENWSGTKSAILLILIAFLSIYSGTIGNQFIDAAVQATPSVGKDNSDVALYRSAIDAVAKGENYYAFITAEQRARGFPTKPFVTVRPPFLAWFSAALGQLSTQLAIYLLAGIVAAVWWRKLPAMDVPPVYAICVTLIIASTCLMLCADPLPLFHESWAGLLIALSLGLRDSERFAIAVVIGLLAALVREMAIAYLLLMFVFAVYERKFMESVGWSIAILLACVALGIHAWALEPYIRQEDLTSPGWQAMGGWKFYISATYLESNFLVLPASVGQALVPLCLFGWLSLKSRDAFRVAGLLCGFALMVMLFARPVNIYWALLSTPLTKAGLIFAAIAIVTLISNIVRRNPAKNYLSNR